MDLVPVVATQSNGKRGLVQLGADRRAQDRIMRGERLLEPPQHRVHLHGVVPAQNDSESLVVTHRPSMTQPRFLQQHLVVLVTYVPNDHFYLLNG